MSEPYRGGCACGAVRYKFESYTDAGYCHCNACRAASAAPVSAWARVVGFRVTDGAPRAHAGRHFCADCGTGLYRSVSPPEVTIGSLDAPAAIEPRIHRWIPEQLPWLKLADMLPFADGSDLPPLDERNYVRLPVEPSVGRDSQVSLREVTKQNARAVLFADVTGSQRRFVAPNAVSVAQGALAGDAWYRAVYADDTAVGFVMAAVIEQDELGLPTGGDPNLWRFMIDEHYQGLGFGKRALDLTIAELRSWGGSNIWVGAVPGPGSPYEFYIRAGFVDTGVVDDGEAFLRLAVEPG